MGRSYYSKKAIISIIAHICRTGGLLFGVKKFPLDVIIEVLSEYLDKLAETGRNGKNCRMKILTQRKLIKACRYLGIDDESISAAQELIQLRFTTERRGDRKKSKEKRKSKNQLELENSQRHEEQGEKKFAPKLIWQAQKNDNMSEVNCNVHLVQPNKTHEILHETKRKRSLSSSESDIHSIVQAKHVHEYPFRKKARKLSSPDKEVDKTDHANRNLGSSFNFHDENGNEIWLCPGCNKPDDGSPMIWCDICENWFHWVCAGIKVAPRKRANWYCRPCIKWSMQQNDLLICTG